MVFKDEEIWYVAVAKPKDVKIVQVLGRKGDVLYDLRIEGPAIPAFHLPRSKGA